MAGANLAKKKVVVQNLKSDFDGITAAIVSHYAGVNVEQITKLRASLREQGIKFKVVKNKISIRAVEGTPLEPLKAYFKGPTGVAYSNSDPVALAKALKTFAETQDKFVIQGGVLEGSLLNKAQVIELAKVPSREVLLARLVGSMQKPYASIVYALSGILRKVESAAPASAPAPEATETTTSQGEAN